MIAFSRSEVAMYYTVRVQDLRQRGKRWRGPCPIHRGRHDSFSVDPDTGLWRCWSDCGRGGDVVKLEIELTGTTWREAVNEIERIIGRVLLDRPTTQAERRAFPEKQRAATAAAEDIAFWRDALIPELNALKIVAVETGDDIALARAASLCNLLENSSAADSAREYIRHRASAPVTVARLIATGRERDLEAQRIAAEAVLLLAAEELRDAA